MIPEQTLEQLNSHFAIAGVLAFHQMPSGLIFADITTPVAAPASATTGRATGAQAAGPTRPGPHW